MMHFRRSILAPGALLLLGLLQACSDSCNPHLKYGQPGETDLLLCREGYALGYDYHYRNPAWVVAYLTAETINAPDRSYPVKHDREIERGLRLEYRDFRGSRFEPGRLHTLNGAPGDEDFEETFLLSNSTPQYKAVQRQLWPRVTDYEAALINRYNRAWVATGPVYAGPNQTLGRTRIGVPSHFYKVYYLPDQQRMSALLIPNTARPGNRALARYATTVDNIEAYTGLDFFHKLLNVDEDHMKSDDRFIE